MSVFSEFHYRSLINDVIRRFQLQYYIFLELNIIILELVFQFIHIYFEKSKHFKHSSTAIAK